MPRVQSSVPLPELVGVGVKQTEQILPGCNDALLAAPFPALASAHNASRMNRCRIAGSTRDV